jgi:hypothetical protein
MVGNDNRLSFLSRQLQIAEPAACTLRAGLIDGPEHGARLAAAMVWP